MNDLFPKQRILVADDDTVFRQRLIRALASRGFATIGAACVAEAAAIVQDHIPDCAIVDLRMPGKSGLELVRQLMALNPQMRVVVLTGFGSIATAVEALRLGAVDYLTKPADTEQILSALQGRSKTNSPPAEIDPSLARVEWEHIQRILTACDGNISETARRLGIHRRSLQRKLAKMPPEESSGHNGTAKE